MASEAKLSSLLQNADSFFSALISNAFDALARIQYEASQDPSKLDSGNELHVKIILDQADSTLTIFDTGIGMKGTEMNDYLHMFGVSGTKAFKESLTSGTNVNLFGKFGVSFRCALVVAKKITVTSKHNEDVQHVWQSHPDGSTVTRLDEPDSERISRGTKVVLHLNKDHYKYLDPVVIERMLQEQIQFTAYPIDLITRKLVQIGGSRALSEAGSISSPDLSDSTSNRYSHEKRRKKEQPLYIFCLKKNHARNVT